MMNGFRLACLWSLIVLGVGDLSARDLNVDPHVGDDASDGTALPVKTIARAIRLAQPGDVIHLRPMVYRDWAAFFDKAGEPGKPITLDGHGATLDGCDPLDPAAWREVEPGLYRHDDLLPLTQAIVDRWFFVWDGRLNRMNRCSKGPSEPLKQPGELKPREWTFVLDATRPARPGYIHGAFWLKLPAGQSLADAKIEAPLRPAGVLMHGKSAHLVVKNLTSVRPYNDGFNLSDCRDITFENIRAMHCGDDGISAHGDCRYQVNGFVSIGNATGICDTGNSETAYRGVFIRDCVGFDLFFLDTGRYSVTDALVISSAAKAVYLQARDQPANPCTVTLDNVLIRRVSTPNEIRVSPNCRLIVKQSTLLNLDLQAPGGEIVIESSLYGGVVPSTPPRQPHIHLWKDATWRGNGNWYDFSSVRNGQQTFTASSFEGFQKEVAAESASRWLPLNEAQALSAKIGADPRRLPFPE